MVASTISPWNLARGTCVANFFASRAATSNPTLCRVSLYLLPGLPRPTISFMFAASSSLGGGELLTPSQARIHSSTTTSSPLLLPLPPASPCGSALARQLPAQPRPQEQPPQPYVA